MFESMPKSTSQTETELMLCDLLVCAQAAKGDIASTIESPLSFDLLQRLQGWTAQASEP